MEYKKQTQKLVLRSASRASYSTSSTDCVIRFQNPVSLLGGKNITRELELAYFAIYNSIYTINSSNNKINFNENSTNKTATITSGSYTGALLASAVKTALDTASGGFNTFTVSYDNVSRKFTFSSANNFTLLFSTGSDKATTPYKALGFYSQSSGLAVDSTTSTNIVSPQQCDLGGPISLLMNIKEWNSGDEIQTSDNEFATFYIPLLNGSGGICIYDQTLFKQVATYNNCPINAISQLSIKIYPSGKNNTSTTADIPLDWECVLNINSYC